MKILLDFSAKVGKETMLGGSPYHHSMARPRVVNGGTVCSNGR
jgi:hypothetical protein